MLTLEPRASDDETLESEASIGTADSSENLNMDSEGTTSDFSGTPCSLTSHWLSEINVTLLSTNPISNILWLDMMLI